MGLIYQRFTNISVNRTGADVTLDIDFQDTNREDYLSLVLDPATLKVKETKGETPRNAQGIVGNRDLDFLIGKQIYFSGAREIRESLTSIPEEEREHYNGLMLEGITSVVQAEAFLLPERGFTSHQEYEQYFRDTYGRGCVYYSNLPRIKKDFVAYVEENNNRREGNLFNRHRLVTVRRAPTDDKFLIRGNICDSFHEMAIKLLVDKNKQIFAIRSSFLRSPDPICHESSQTFECLLGEYLAPENRKNLLKCSSGPNGCTHLGDLVLEGARALEQVL